MLLELQGVSKSFGSTRALEGVNFAVSGGEVVALMGENGAGKSTLMKVLTGIWPAGSYEGTVRAPGSIAMVHQELAVFPELTVAEHLELDRLPRWVDWGALYKRVDEFLRRIGFDLSASARVGDLSIGERQQVEIARAVYRDPAFIVFDEPTSALTETETEKLFAVIGRLKSEGKGIIYITHRFDEVFRLADRIVVLRDGKNAGEIVRPRTDHTRPEAENLMIRYMVGRSIEEVYPPRKSRAQQQPELLRVENLTVEPSGGGVPWVNQVSFVARRGEILGLGGLLGAGRTETLHALFGVFSGQGPNRRGVEVKGTVWIEGKAFAAQSPRESLRRRVVYLSEDRKVDGLVLGQSVQSNLLLSWHSAGGAPFWIPLRKERELAHEWTGRLKVKLANLEQPIQELSGGNQQKVALAKALLLGPEVLMIDEPTRGVDVGARSEIYQWVRGLADQGVAVLLVSSEMPELMGLSDRVLVMREGRLSGEFDARTAQSEDIMRAASL